LGAFHDPFLGEVHPCLEEVLPSGAFRVPCLGEVHPLGAFHDPCPEEVHPLGAFLGPCRVRRKVACQGLRDLEASSVMELVRLHLAQERQKDQALGRVLMVARVCLCPRV